MTSIFTVVNKNLSFSQFFQSNIDQHNAELLCAEELAETLDLSSMVDEKTRHEVEGKLSELRERWKTTCSAVEKHKQTLDSRLMKWRDFKRKHKEFITWLSEFETRPGLESVVSSDINELETHVEYVEVCEIKEMHKAFKYVQVKMILLLLMLYYFPLSNVCLILQCLGI